MTAQPETGAWTRVLDQHAKMLQGSGISVDHALRRGYRSIRSPYGLKDIRIAKAGQSTPGLLIPLLRKDETIWGYLYRQTAPNQADRSTRPRSGSAMESMSRQVLVSASMIHRFRSGTLKEARKLTLPSAQVCPALQ